MSVIYLIRHGQASLYNSDYDQLSSVGIKQAETLGDALMQRKIVPSILQGGAMKRHHQTASFCTKSMQSMPTFQECSSWNEYDHKELIVKHNPALDSFDQVTKHLKSKAHPGQALQQLLNDALLDWITDKHNYTLTWDAFKEQSWRELNDLASKLEGKQTAWVFTSGGPIAAILINLLDLKNEQFMSLLGRIVNASVTKIVVGKNGLSLSTYNDYSHLDSEPDLITYR